jgi:hypothetical protein
MAGLIRESRSNDSETRPREVADLRKAVGILAGILARVPKLEARSELAEVARLVGIASEPVVDQAVVAREREANARAKASFFEDAGEPDDPRYVALEARERAMFGQP